MDLSALPDSRKLTVEWFNPATGETIPQNSIPAGSSSKSFTSPFTGDAVLYLVDTEWHRQRPDQREANSHLKLEAAMTCRALFEQKKQPCHRGRFAFTETPLRPQKR